MKKYLSCIILIVLCIVCATVFYVSAMDFESEQEETPPASSATPKPQAPSKEPPKRASIDKSGTILSERLTNVNLRLEWAMYKIEGEPTIYLSAELYLDTPEQITNAGSGYISINGKKKEFTTNTMVGTSNLLSAYSLAVEGKGEDIINFECYLDISAVTESGDTVKGLFAKGSAVASEKQLSKSHLIELDHISMFPELPSGDEITSLCMVLNYLKYDIDKCELSDLYLDKGPAHYTDTEKANAGNPKDTYNSYGCLPPVIVNAANKFISINGGSFSALSLSGQEADSLYRLVSQNIPVIVWACEEFDSTPSVFRTLIIDGKTVYLKSNVCTMVLIGYDLEKKTVTLASPHGNVFDLDMDLFELRYAQVGSLAVAIK